MRKISLIVLFLVLVLIGCDKDSNITRVRQDFIVNQSNRNEYIDLDIDLSRTTSGDRMLFTLTVKGKIKIGYDGGSVDLKLEMSNGDTVLSSDTLTINSKEEVTKIITYETSIEVGTVLRAIMNYGVYDINGSVYTVREYYNESTYIKTSLNHKFLIHIEKVLS